jgi:hypothetical protein
MPRLPVKIPKFGYRAAAEFKAGQQSHCLLHRRRPRHCGRRGEVRAPPEAGAPPCGRNEVEERRALAPQHDGRCVDARNDRTAAAR